MAKKTKIRLKDIWKKFKKTQIVYVATIDAGKPRVRPMTLIHHDRKLWVSTYTSDVKVGQIKKNPNVEFCLHLQAGKRNGYIRGFGKARIIKSRPTRLMMAKAIPFFKAYWDDPDDSRFCLIQLKLKNIEYLAPGNDKTVRLKV
jgi:general stress protein 26